MSTPAPNKLGPDPDPESPAPAGTPLDSKITRAVVYRQGARVTRTGEVTLPAGEHLLRVEDLPRSLDEDSVRVKGTGPGSIVNINVREVFTEQTPSAEIERVKRELKASDREIQELQRALDLLASKAQAKRELQEHFYEEAPQFYAAGDLGFASFRELDAHLHEEVAGLSERIQASERDMARLQTKHRKIEHQLDKLGTRADVERTYAVDINLVTRGEGSEAFQLAVSYVMEDAHWLPLYDVNLGTDTAQVKLLANVVNYTTEDWPDVSLEVSTASIQPITTEKPDPFILREWRPPPPPRPRHYEKRRRIMAKSEKKGDTSFEFEIDEDVEGFGGEAKVSAEEPEPAPMEEVQGEVADSVGVLSYKLPAPVSVPSDKNPHPVTLTTVDLPSTKKLFWSVANPGTVVAQDTLVNGDLVLLPGSAKIYHAEEYLGETAVPLIAPKQEFDLGTRVSYDVTVTRKLVDRSRDKKLLKGKIRRHYAYAIKVKNLAGVACPLKLVDRVPHADSEKIKVDVDFGATPPAKNKLGVVTWTLDLAGVTETEIAYTYTVSYDKDINISPSLP